MSEMQLLWNYQQADIAVDRYEKEMRADPNRQKLVKYREFLLQQQDAMKRIESDVESMKERLRIQKEEIERLRDDLTDFQETLNETEPENIDIARKSLSYAQKLVNMIGRCEQELAKLKKDAEAKDRLQHEIRVRAAKVKSEFDALKQTYDGEYREQSVALAGLKAKAAKAAEGISDDLLKKYEEIKHHSVPPIAKLIDGNRCGGCNMNLPQVLQRSIRTGAEYVECENCGRIILVE